MNHEHLKMDIQEQMFYFWFFLCVFFFQKSYDLKIVMFQPKEKHLHRLMLCYTL
jgi:hypothetical protein